MPTPSNGYRAADGSRIPGTTGIISRFKDSGALIKWAYRQGRDHEALAAVGKDAPRDLYDVTQAAADIGTVAHAMVEARINGQDAMRVLAASNLPPEGLAKAHGSFQAYEAWASMSRLEIIDQEMMLVSEAYRFGGTPDAIGRVNGKLCLVDWKTSNAVYCHPPGTRVLTHDWRWVPVEALQVGDRLRAFTEARMDIGLGGRHWTDSTVTHTSLSKSATGVRIKLESGRQLVSTAQHPYLAIRSAGGRRLIEGGTIWLKAQDLRVGNYLPRYFDPWDTDQSYEAGWFAGILDGEGYLSKYVEPQKTMRLGFAQKRGPVLDRAKEFMASRSISYREQMPPNGVVQIAIRGGTREVARIIGSTRPVRLLPKFEPEGALMSPRDCRDRIVSIEQTGPIDVVNLSTSSGTYFAEGFGSHNSDYLLQLAAYRQLWEENHPDQPLIGGFHLCRFSKDHGDFSHHYYPELGTAWEMFKRLREAYEFDKELRKRAA